MRRAHLLPLHIHIHISYIYISILDCQQNKRNKFHTQVATSHLDGLGDAPRVQGFAPAGVYQSPIGSTISYPMEAWKVALTLVVSPRRAPKTMLAIKGSSLAPNSSAAAIWMKTSNYGVTFSTSKVLARGACSPTG